MPTYTQEQITKSEELLRQGNILGAASAQQTGVSYTPTYAGSYDTQGQPVTTLASANVEEKYRPESQERMQKLTNNGQTRDANGALINADGSPVKFDIKTNPSGKPSSDETDADGYLMGDQPQREMSAVDLAKKRFADENELYESVKARSDPATQRMIASIQAQLQDNVRIQEDINNRLYQGMEAQGLESGSLRYSMSGQGILAQQEKWGAGEISRLNNEAQALIAGIQQAAESDNWQSVDRLLNEAEAKKKEMQEVATRTAKNIVEDSGKLQNQALIYDALQDPNGAKDVMGIYGSLRGHVGVDEIKDFFDKTTPKKVDGGFEFTPTQTAQMMGLGLGVPQIQSSLDFIKTGGYPAFAAMLTPAERKVFDPIFLPKDPKAIAAGSGVGLSSFDKFAQEQIALSAVPVQLRNTEAELNRFLSGIRLGLAQGMTPYKVADTLMGYQIENPDSFSEGMRNYMNLLPDLNGVQATARLINGGNYVGAVTKLENQVMENQRKVDPEGHVGESTTLYYVNKATQINKTLDDAGFFNSVGVFGGTFSQALGRFRSPQAAKIRAEVTSLVSELRNHLAGTSVTDSERSFLEPLIPALSDKLPTFRTKLNELPTNSLSKLNSVRSTAGLPMLDQAALKDKRRRIPLYGIGEETMKSVQDPLGILSGGGVSENNPLGI